MSIESAARPHVKVTLVNMRTMEEQPVLANPQDLETALEVNWNNLVVPGLSHEILQYRNTSNVSFPLALECTEFDFSREVMDDFERFLEACCYPDYGAQGILQGAPPNILIVWPKVLSMTVVIKSFNVKRTQFAADDGRCIRYTANLKVEEKRDGRLGASDVRARGMRRSAAGQGSLSSADRGTGTGTEGTG
jgi:hypothetical protein